MNRKLTLFICASFILLFCFPSASTAAERREEIIRFDNDAPASIRFILDESGYQNVSIIHGAAIIREHYDERGMQLDWSMAALIIEQSGHRQFLGMQWVIGTKNVVIETNDMVDLDKDKFITLFSEEVKNNKAFYQGKINIEFYFYNVNTLDVCGGKVSCNGVQMKVTFKAFYMFNKTKEYRYEVSAFE